jgi:2'-5' RNA ligase
LDQLRLFWAVNLPPAIKARLAALQKKLKEARADAKWVEEENLHLTLQFLGNVEVSRIGVLLTNMQNAVGNFPSFRLKICGLGFFPDLKRPRVLWAGTAGDLSFLRQLQKLVEKANLLSGFPPEKREFSPHLTLARLRSPRELETLKRKIEELKDAAADLGELAVTSVDLMKSELGPRGAAYTLLGAAGLGPFSQVQEAGVSPTGSTGASRTNSSAGKAIFGGKFFAGGSFPNGGTGMKVRKRVLISGLVQGVYFRASTRDAAAAAGVTGWVRNRRDGRVEAVFEGEEEAVESMVKWCWKGSPSSRVEKVEVSSEEYRGEFPDFRIAPTV